LARYVAAKRAGQDDMRIKMSHKHNGARTCPKRRINDTPACKHFPFALLTAMRAAMKQTQNGTAI